MTSLQTLYQQALYFAARKHEASGERVKGTDLPYIVHVCNVAMEILVAAPQSGEFDTAFAVQVALLHDTIEDTDTMLDEIRQMFGTDIATAVAALTKNESLPKKEQINDSLRRIKPLAKEVWAVKLADRIANLMPPPHDWKHEQISEVLQSIRKHSGRIERWQHLSCHPAFGENKRIQKIFVIHYSINILCGCSE